MNLLSLNFTFSLCNKTIFSFLSLIVVVPDVGAAVSRQNMMTTWMSLNIAAIIFYHPGRNLGALDLLKAQHQL